MCAVLQEAKTQPSKDLNYITTLVMQKIKPDIIKENQAILKILKTSSISRHKTKTD